MHSPLRRQPAPRTLLAGKVVFNNKCCVMDCVVRELSPRHAIISMPNTSGVPNMLELRIPSRGATYSCEATFRTLYEIRLGILR